MGLTLRAVAKNYHYSSRKGDMVGKTYGFSTDCGAIGFKIFRDKLISFVTGGDIKCLDDLNEKLGGNEYADIEEGYRVAMLEDDLGELKGGKVYKKELKDIQDRYPKLYDIFPFVMHYDTEGYINYDSIDKVLPIIVDFHDEYPEYKGGYAAWDYNWIEELIDIMEDVVEHKGRLWYE